MNFTRTNEGGSVVAFAVIAIVLAVLVIGGVYVVQKSNEPKPLPTKVAKSPAPSVAPSKSTSVSPSKTPAPSKKPAVSSPPVKNTPKTGTTPLPVTGPEDNLIQIFMLATLVGTTVAYTQSHRARLALTTPINR